MGAWGNYDDENDPTQDLVMTVNDKVLESAPVKDCQEYSKRPCPGQEKNKKCTQLYHTEENLECQRKKKQYLDENQGKVAKVAIKELKTKKKNESESDKTYLNTITAGIAMHLARQSETPPIFPKHFGTKQRGFEGPPTKLRSDFDPTLAKMAFYATGDLLEDPDHLSSWVDPDFRIEALYDQLDLFSSLPPSAFSSRGVYDKMQKRKQDLEAKKRQILDQVFAKKQEENPEDACLCRRTSGRSPRKTKRSSGKKPKCPKRPRCRSKSPATASRSSGARRRRPRTPKSPRTSPRKKPAPNKK